MGSGGITQTKLQDKRNKKGDRDCTDEALVLLKQLKLLMKL